MDKELLETLEKINKTLEKFNNENSKEIKEKIEKAFSEPATISIKKDADGHAETHIEGKTLAILVTLAGLELAILEKLDVPSGVWGLIKSTVGAEEVKPNE